MKNNDKDQLDILFVLFDIGLYLENSAVFQSQVGDQMLALSSYGYRVGILTNYLDKELFQEKIGDKLEQAGISVFAIKKKKILIDLLGMSLHHIRITKKYDVSQSYVRGLWGPLIIKLLNPFRKHKYVYDVRGDVADEFTNVGGNKIKLRIYLWLETQGILNAHKISVVSNLLGQVVKERTGWPLDYSVIPCCINSPSNLIDGNELKIVRQRIGFSSEHIVFVYSGGLSHYQQVPKMLSLWADFLDFNDVRFLLLTNQDPHSHPTSIEYIKKFGDKLVHLKLPMEEVIPTVSSCDIAFMLREDIPLNNAASPVKFAEYLASGAFIVGSPNIGDASRLITENDLGILINPNDLKEGRGMLKKLVVDFDQDKREQVRKNSRKLLHSNYTWESHELRYVELYGEVSKEKN